MFTHSLRAISFGIFFTLFILGCEQNGFRAVQKEPLIVNAKIENATTPLAQSPRVLAVAEAAKQSSLKMELDALSPKDADVIMALEVQKNSDGINAKISTVRAIIKAYGAVAEYRGVIATGAEDDGKALAISDFQIDKVLVQATGASAEAAANTFQVISHCANACDDLFVHLQFNKNGAFASGAFYNFKREGDAEYKIVNSSVEANYKTLDQVRESLKAN